MRFEGVHAATEMSGNGRGLPRITRERLPAVSADQMREVDRAMIEDVHIDLVQMMENAGRSLADLALGLFGRSSVAVLAGAGGNGGGGLVAARHLANRGVAVWVTVSGSEEHLAPVTRHQLDILQRIDVRIVADPPAADLVLDALIGYSLRGDPAGRAAELIRWANQQSAPMLSLDTPSGLNVTTGMAGHPCVRATATMTLALPKIGLLGASERVGRLYLADISVPPVVYERMGLHVGNPFAEGAIVEVGS
jgi:NAD(P)H-hydrate epimerase